MMRSNQRMEYLFTHKLQLCILMLRDGGYTDNYSIRRAHICYVLDVDRFLRRSRFPCEWGLRKSCRTRRVQAQASSVKVEPNHESSPRPKVLALTLEVKMIYFARVRICRLLLNIACLLTGSDGMNAIDKCECSWHSRQG